MNAYCKPNEIPQLDNLFELLVDFQKGYETYRSLVKQIPYLSASEERELGQKILRGDQASRDEFVLRTLKIVIPYVDYFMELGYSAEDILQEGNLGLIKAIDNFDFTCGRRIYAYAIKSIKMQISNYITQYSRSIRVPYHLSNFMLKKSQAEYDLAVVLGHFPTTEELADKLDVSEDKIFDTKYVENEIISLDDVSKYEDEEYLHYIDTIEDKSLSPEEKLTADDFEKDILELFDELLTPQEKDVMIRYYGFLDTSETYRAIGESYNVCHTTIELIVSRSINKIAKSNKTKKLLKYFDSPIEAYDGLLYKRWTILHRSNRYEDLDSLIAILQYKLKDYSFGELLKYYPYHLREIISLFMGYNGHHCSAREICRVKKINTRLLNSCLNTILTIYRTEINKSELTRLRKYK